MQGRKVSKVVKTTVVSGERMEKGRGDPSLAADLPSAREDFEKVRVSSNGFTNRLLRGSCCFFFNGGTSGCGKKKNCVSC